MKVKVAATQMSCSWDIPANIDRAESLVRDAAKKGAQVVLLQELFETPYFCIDEQDKHLDLAHSLEEQPTIKRMQRLAQELELVLPISFFESAGPAFYNSIAIIDADGSIAGFYRKSHIPHSPAYEEKFYFSPGDTGFKAIKTRYATIGVAICWDQWFPEAARLMVLRGAELLLYPTAIGSEFSTPELDSKDHWQTVMQGHAAANVIPVIASNRIGSETSRGKEMTFYGSSFITNHLGAVIECADRTDETTITAEFDLDEIKKYRRSWGIFRDRRPDLYQDLLTLDGKNAVGAA